VDHTSPLLYELKIALSLAGITMILVMYRQGNPGRQPGLTRRQRVIVAWRRNPLMLPAALACVIAALALMIAS
jgi:hypothetical protein